MEYPRGTRGAMRRVRDIQPSESAVSTEISSPDLSGWSRAQVANIAPHAFFEMPFHARLPPNHPAPPSPWDRLERAGRFMDDDDEEALAKPARRTRGAPKTTAVEKLEEVAEAPAEEKDPLFGDDDSLMLDAALGLDAAVAADDAPAGPDDAADDAGGALPAEDWLVD